MTRDQTTRDHGYGSKYDRNANYVRDRRIRRDKGKPITGSAPKSPGVSASFKIASLVCGFLLLVCGIFILHALFTTNGTATHLRLLSAIDFTRRIFDTVQAEQIHWHDRA